MGGDGGVKATQRRFMRGTSSYKEEKPEAFNIKEQRCRKTKFCAESGNPLQEPIVACELGHMYNKDDLINALLRKTLNETHAHIRGLKDVRSLIFMKNSAEKPVNENEEASAYCCPVTMDEFNGNQPFVFLWSTGYVLSEKAIKEIGIDGLQAEYGPFSEDDIVKLVPTDEEMEIQIQLMLRRRSIIAASMNHEKKSKKRLNSTLDDNGNDNVDEEKKKKSKKKTSEKYVRAAAPTLSAANAVVQSAQELIRKQEANSTVFKTLFHSDKEEDNKKGARDLMMGVAGLRYSVL